MSTSRVPHAIQRAEERYGLQLSLADLLAIAALCTDANRYVRRGPHGVVHVVVWRGVELLPVLIVNELGERIIATFLPPDAFTSTHRQRAYKATLKSRRERRKRARELVE